MPRHARSRRLVVLGVGMVVATFASPASALPGPVLKESRDALEAALECSGGVDNARETPVLLVHGTTSSPEDNWGWGYRLVLPADGFPTCTVRLPDRALVDMQRSVEYVVYAIRRIYDRAGRKVSVIGHSQGGFLPTLALRFWPDLANKVDDFIGLAGAYGRGTDFANVVCGAGSCIPAFWQFRPSSHLLAAYNRRPLPAGPSYTSIFTRDDEIVVPQPRASTIQTPGATNIAVQDFCHLPRTVEHLLIAGDAVAWAIAHDALTHPGPADLSRVSPIVCAMVGMPGLDTEGFLTADPRFVAGITAAAVSRLRTDHEPQLRCYLDARCPKPRLVPVLRASTTPRRDPRPPWTFRTTGTLNLPEGALDQCAGTVVVSVKRGTHTLAARRATVGLDCTFSSSVTIRRPGSLRFLTQFAGDDELLPVSAQPRRVRAG